MVKLTGLEILFPNYLDHRVLTIREGAIATAQAANQNRFKQGGEVAMIAQQAGQALELHS